MIMDGENSPFDWTLTSNTWPERTFYTERFRPPKNQWAGHLLVLLVRWLWSCQLYVGSIPLLPRVPFFILWCFVDTVDMWPGALRSLPLWGVVSSKCWILIGWRGPHAASTMLDCTTVNALFRRSHWWIKQKNTCCTNNSMLIDSCN